jgi:hypothetical protein
MLIYIHIYIIFRRQLVNICSRYRYNYVTYTAISKECFNGSKYFIHPSLYYTYIILKWLLVFLNRFEEDSITIFVYIIQRNISQISVGEMYTYCICVLI